MNTETKTAEAQPYAMAIGRTLLALIFLLSGLSKLGALAGTQAYMEAMHVPGVLLWPTILFEIGTGALVIVGYQTRVVAALLAGFSLLTGVIFHSNFSDPIQMIMFLKNVSMAGGLVLLAAVGAGRFSIDARSGRA